MPKRFTAKEITEILKAEGDNDISIRTVRFYTDQKLIPELVKEGIKNYTEEHLDYIRALRSLNKAGMPLLKAKDQLVKLDNIEIKRVHTSYQEYSPETVLRSAMSMREGQETIKTVWINDDLSIQYTDKFPIEKLKEIVKAIQKILK